MSTDTLVLVVLTLLGLAVGSFLNVAVHRVPLRLSVVSPGSRCPSCGYVLGWADNIPVASYLLLGGRCRGCRATISIRYPIVELVTMGVFILHFVVFGTDAILVPRLLLACAMIVLFAIDLEHHLLPNVITVPGIVVGFLFSFLFPPGPVASALGLLIGGGSLWLIGEAYYRYAGQEGMGGGDVKMLAMIGAFLGWKLVLVTLVFSSIAGALAGLVVIASRRGDLRYALPYGTFLALAGLMASLYGDRIVAWYLGFYAA
jgi:leader peptidase (prepilin peptidase) / N-methyltransferase